MEITVPSNLKSREEIIAYCQKQAEEYAAQVADKIESEEWLQGLHRYASEHTAYTFDSLDALVEHIAPYLSASTKGRLANPLRPARQRISASRRKRTEVTPAFIEAVKGSYARHQNCKQVQDECGCSYSVVRGIVKGKYDHLLKSGK